METKKKRQSTLHVPVEIQRAVSFKALQRDSTISNTAAEALRLGLPLLPPHRQDQTDDKEGDSTNGPVE